MMLHHFRRVIHCDWSVSTKKRFACKAHRPSNGWLVDAPEQITELRAFIDDALGDPQPTLIGFDFPIGVPQSFGLKSGFGDFLQAFDHFGFGQWADFFKVAESAEEISLHRPFYPQVSTAAARQQHLVKGLGLEDFEQLRRECERATPKRQAACALFWTLGGNQVGKAAIAGWKDVLRPARERGALLWPFEGDLSGLSSRGKLVLCETYPGEAYSHVGINLKGKSKRSQPDRKQASAGLIFRSHKHNIEFSSHLQAEINDGFGSGSSGEDKFDAVIGLLGMLEVIEGRRAEAPSNRISPAWEGWIMGQS